MAMGYIGQFKRLLDSNTARRFGQILRISHIIIQYKKQKPVFHTIVNG